MGTWGTGLYSNDDALDIKEDVRDMLAYGWSIEEVIIEIVHQYELDSVNENTSSLWLAFADTLWNYGCLSEDIKKKAIYIIDEEIDLATWSRNSKCDRKKREVVLRKLRNKLVSPQPKHKQPHKPRFFHCNWPIGSIYTLPAENGGFHAFLVVGQSLYKPNDYATVNDYVRIIQIAMLYWDGNPEQIMQDLSNHVPVLGVPFFNGAHDGEIVSTYLSLNPYDFPRNIIKTLIPCGQLSLQLCQSIMAMGVEIIASLSDFERVYAAACAAKTLCNFLHNGELSSLDLFQCNWEIGAIYALPAQTNLSLPSTGETKYHAFVVVDEGTYSPFSAAREAYRARTVYIAMLKWEGHLERIMLDLGKNVPIILQTHTIHGQSERSLYRECRPLGITNSIENAMILCGKIPQRICRKIKTLYSPLSISTTLDRFEYDYRLCNTITTKVYCFSYEEDTYSVTNN